MSIKSRRSTNITIFACITSIIVMLIYTRFYINWGILVFIIIGAILITCTIINRSLDKPKKVEEPKFRICPVCGATINLDVEDCPQCNRRI